MSKSEIDKIKAVLSETNEDESRILAGRQGVIITNLTKALEIAVEALEEIKCYGHSELCQLMKPIREHYRCSHEEAEEALKQISEILEAK